MTTHADPADPAIARAAAAMLERHERGEAEANITSAVRDFLIAAGLAKAEEIVEERHPALGARTAVDLTALDTFIECKVRVGTGIDPDPANIAQLDGYLAESEKQGRVRMGVLTDGKHWLLRWPGAGPVSTAHPYAVALEEADRWVPLYEWLRDHALSAEENKTPDRDAVAAHFGPNSPAYRRDITALKALYAEHAALPTIQVKRRLWRDLLRAALGEVARSDDEWDDLFVRHTYLTAVIGVVVQASFGIDIYKLAGDDPDDLVHGRTFRRVTGAPGVIESDFFAWPAEVGGRALLRNLGRRAAKFDWRQAPNDIAAVLYETVIPPAERRQLGEYYTPDWLARAIVRELVDDPLDQRVLDPSCGSGTFIAEAIAHFLDAAKETDLDPKEVLDRLRLAVTGIDVHPVAVHLARAAWALAARPALQAAVGYNGGLTIPVYLGDALQLRFRAGDLFAEREVTIQVGDDENTELVFPVSLVERANNFDALMLDVTESIQIGDDPPRWALNDHHITDPHERALLETTIDTLVRLHAEGRDHIWAYYTRNMVRPVALSRAKVDVIVGNPPWINYNQTADALRAALERRSKDEYGIWTGGRYATHQDVAGLFFARAVDLYLKDDGVIGMVMPHSALQAGQYAKWRTGRWRAAAGTEIAVDFGHKKAWDLEKLEPNTFFPIASSVAFAKRTPRGGKPTPLVGEVERWRGKTGADDVRRELAAIADTSAAGASPYADTARQGAVIVPRRFFFIDEIETSAVIQVDPVATVKPRRSSYDKEPWRGLDLSPITGEDIETTHLFDIHLGETVAPYAALGPLKAVLPLTRGNYEIPANGTGGIDREKLRYRMRRRWRIVSELWEAHKSSVNKLDLLGQLDYYGKLSAQLEWQRNPDGKPLRVVYTKSGAPTAALLPDDDAIVDHLLFWIPCKDLREAHYLLAVINSGALYEAVAPLMSKGQFGARDLHKHLWKLPIPEFDPANPAHAAVSKAGEAAARGAADQLAALRAERGGDVTVAIARRELRAWLRASNEGRAVEEAVSALLAG